MRKRNGVVPRKLRDPRAPTKYEVEQHNLAHIPYRSWCPHCVRGKAVNSHHAAKHGKPDDELKSISRISLDYWYMGENDRKAQTNLLLVVLDEDSEAIIVCAVGQKGVQEWVVRKVAKELEGWGYGGGECIFKSDGEPSIIACKRSIKGLFGGERSP